MYKIILFVIYLVFAIATFSDGYDPPEDNFVFLIWIPVIWFKIAYWYDNKDRKLTNFIKDWKLLLEVSIQKNNLDFPYGLTTVEFNIYDWFIKNWNKMTIHQKKLILSYTGYNFGTDKNNIPYFSRLDKLDREWGSDDIRNLYYRNSDSNKAINFWVSANWNTFNQNQKELLKDYGIVKRKDTKNPNLIYANDDYRKIFSIDPIGWQDKKWKLYENIKYKE